VPVERLTPDEVTRRWPGVSGEGLVFALFEPEGGAIMTRRGVQAAARTLVAEGGRFELAQIRADLLPDFGPGRSAGGRLESVESSDGRRWEAGAVAFGSGPWRG